MMKLNRMDGIKILSVSMAVCLVACGSDPEEEASDDQLAVEILSGPAEITNETSAQFELRCNADDECEFVCGLDEGELESCDASVTYEDLDDGDYQFFAAAIYDGEQSETDQYGWTIDTVSPEVEFTSTPDATVEDDAVTFAFECTNKPECTFECAVNRPGEEGNFVDCTSPYEISGLGDGLHTFFVRATDAAGNEETISYDWTVTGNGGGGEDQGWQSFDLGEAFGCAIDLDESLWCWGRGSDGQLGLGDSWLRYSPEKVGEGTELEQGWKSVSAGRYHTCAIRTDDSLWCWGDGSNGRTGLGDEEERLEPEQVGAGSDLASGWDSVKALSTHSCALRDGGQLWCWGRGSALGLGEDTEDQMTPQQVGAGTDQDSGWADISGGFNYTCAVRDDQTLWCWGVADRIGLGSDAEFESTPAQLALGTDIETGWTQVYGHSGNHTCALRQDDTLYCWGQRTDGRLGVGEDIDYEQALVPNLVAEGTELEQGWTTAAADGRHSCGVRTDDSLWCWGRNEDGELGIGDEELEDAWSPVQVEAGSELESGWASVKAGLYFSCALRDDHSLWCWGRSGNGRLGLGEGADDQWAPQQVRTAGE